jgi:hypothetical protein
MRRFYSTTTGKTRQVFIPTVFIPKVNEENNDLNVYYKDLFPTGDPKRNFLDEMRKSLIQNHTFDFKEKEKAVKFAVEFLKGNSVHNLLFPKILKGKAQEKSFLVRRKRQ